MSRKPQQRRTSYQVSEKPEYAFGIVTELLRISKRHRYIRLILDKVVYRPSFDSLSVKLIIHIPKITENENAIFRLFHFLYFNILAGIPPTIA